jgi:signal transduction protein with GAF and PtsI domain
VTCSHANRFICWSTIGSSGDPLQYRCLREQCIDCGRLLPRSLAHALATTDTPDVDVERAMTAVENERQQWAQRGQEFAERRAREHEEWWEKYSHYLQTPEWGNRRKLVFDRAGNICEGCREHRATQVHHLSYDHVTDEFCWELVAICDECHRRLHPHMVQS